MAKLGTDGALLWNTFLGGSAADAGRGIAVDASGTISVTGGSAGLWGAPIRAFAGGGDAFAARLDDSGALVWHTFLGAGGLDSGHDIAVDTNRGVSVTGTSDGSWGAPIRPWSANDDAFAAKLDTNGALVWNTFLGGAYDDKGGGIAIDAGGNAFITGWSFSSGFAPGTGWADGFAARLDSNGVLTWDTVLGADGFNFDFGYSIAVTAKGDVYVSGESGYPWGDPVHAFGGYYDAFVARLAPDPLLTIVSTNPTSGVAITVAPSDSSGQGDGTTPFTRVYAQGDSLTLTAPSTAGGNPFSSWIGCTSSSGTICSVTMGAPVTARAYYRNLGSIAAVSNDFDGDGRSDIGCYYPPGGTWYGFDSGDGFWQRQFGYAGTLPVTGDFDGDGTSDIGVYHPDTGSWHIQRSSEGLLETTFGYAGTIPVVGDFDGDGRDDIGCYYAPGGNWYVAQSKDGFLQTTFGYDGTIPVVGDFDGDGRSDLGCYYPAGGNWYIFQSTQGFWQTVFGYAGTEPVVGDFDGDGKSDLGCYYPTGGNWYVFRSTEGFWQAQFGYEGTIPLGGVLR